MKIYKVQNKVHSNRARYFKRIKKAKEFIKGISRFNQWKYYIEILEVE